MVVQLERLGAPEVFLVCGKGCNFEGAYHRFLFRYHTHWSDFQSLIDDPTTKRVPTSNGITQFREVLLDGMLSTTLFLAPALLRHYCCGVIEIWKLIEGLWYLMLRPALCVVTLALAFCRTRM